MTYQNCADAYAHGVADIPRTHPSYAAKLDRDNDGVGCELKDAPNGFHPRAAPTSTKAPTATPTVTGTKQPVAADGQLPVTGPAAEVGVVGGLLLTVGAACLVLARRRRSA